MTKKPDGGPAYPQMRVWNAALAEYEDTQQYPGMTLRDYFAAKFLAGVTADPTSYEVFDSMGDVAKNAYRMADAMIKARGE